MTNVTSTPQPSDDIDIRDLPSELRGIAADHLEEAIANTAKAKGQSAKLQARHDAEHALLVSNGEALDLIEAAKRCYSAGSHGTEQLGVKKSG